MLDLTSATLSLSQVSQQLQNCPHVFSAFPSDFAVSDQQGNFKRVVLNGVVLSAARRVTAWLKAHYKVTSLGLKTDEGGKQGNVSKIIK